MKQQDTMASSTPSRDSLTEILDGPVEVEDPQRILDSLETALDHSDDDEVKYHLRQTVQFLIAEQQTQTSQQ